MNVVIYIIDGLLVGFLAKEENRDFPRLGEFQGPYPGRTPVVFAGQAARLGFGSALFSCAGNDAFGEMNIARLGRDDVNVGGTAMPQKTIAGSVFVSHHGQAQYDSIFNIPSSACGLLTTDHIDEALLNQCQHPRIMGSLLFSLRIIDTMRKTIEDIKGRNGTVSFNPNIREEILNIPEMSQALKYILDCIDIFLPSDDELDYFGLNLEHNEQILVNNLLKRGMKHVVVKRGPCGASYFNANETYHAIGFNVPVVDPTGAGDCFGATFVNLFLNGVTPQGALRWANANDSLAINQRSPIEGTSMQAQVRALLAAQHL